MLWPSNEKVKSSKWDQGPARHWHWGQAGALVKLHVPLSLTADAITPSASLMFDMALPFDVSDVLEHLQQGGQSDVNGGGHMEVAQVGVGAKMVTNWP